MGTRPSRIRADVLVAVGVLVVVALVMAVPRLQSNKVASSPTPESSLGLDGCPMPGTTAEPDAVKERVGTFLPAGGTRITLCRMSTDPTDPRVNSRQSETRVLTTQVADMIALLNQLPNISGLKWIGEATGVRRAEPRADQFSCTDSQHATELSFVVQYPDGPPAVVWLDEHCASATYDGRTRYGLGEALTAFYRYLRAELATIPDHRDLRAKPCPTTLTAVQLDRRGASGQGRDEIAANRGPTDDFLPSPVAAVSACRYTVSRAGARLVRGTTVSAVELAVLALAVNNQFASATVHGYTSCGEPTATSPTTLVDLLVVVDETAAVAHVRLIREPCAAALVSRKAALVPSAHLVSLVDRVLGPVS